MSYLLDSDVCVAVLNGVDAALRERLQRCAPADVVVCAIVRAELAYGAHHSQRAAANLQKLTAFLAPLGSLDFDDEAAGAYGRVRATLRRAGTPVGGNDLLIAALALAHGHIVVTRNVREFTRIEGLTVERW